MKTATLLETLLDLAVVAAMLFYFITHQYDRATCVAAMICAGAAINYSRRMRA